MTIYLSFRKKMNWIPFLPLPKRVSYELSPNIKLKAPLTQSTVLKEQIKRGSEVHQQKLAIGKAVYCRVSAIWSSIIYSARDAGLKKYVSLHDGKMELSSSLQLDPSIQFQVNLERKRFPITCLICRNIYPIGTDTALNALLDSIGNENAALRRFQES